mgnify:CR=1 FL=1
MQSGNIYYAKQDDLVVLKFVGQIRYTLGDSYRISASLDTFLNRLFDKKDFRHVVIDLTEADTIDSTNLGLLARVARFTKSEFGTIPTILVQSDDIYATLDSVGFNQVFRILSRTDSDHGTFEPVAAGKKSEDELARMVLDAHKQLVSLNSKNRDMFKNVIDLLEKRMGDKN